MATVSTDTNLSSVTYAVGEVITVINGATLTINTTPVNRPGTISCTTRGKILIVNTTNTLLSLIFNTNTNDLIVTGNGILEVRGQPMQVHVGTGAAGQSFGVTCDYPTYVEVETAAGSNLYRPWYVAASAEPGTIVYANHAAICRDGLTGNVLLFNPAAKTLTAGDGTNGNVIPSGCRVRIPNIFVNSFVSNTGGTNRSQIACNAAGTVDLEWVAFGDNFYVQLQNYLSARLRQVGAVAPMEVLNASGLFDAQNLVINIDPRSSNTSLACSNLTGEFRLQQLYSLTTSSTGQSYIGMSAVSLFQNIEAFAVTRSTATATAIAINNVPNALLKNLWIIGARLTLTDLLRTRVDGIFYSDRLNGVPDTVMGLTMVVLTNVKDSIVRNIQLISGGAAGGIAPYGDILSVDANSSNVVIQGLLINAQMRSARLGTVNGSSITIARSTFTNNRTPNIQSNLGDGVVYRDVTLTPTTSIQGGSRQHIDLVSGIRSTGLANAFEDGCFNTCFGTTRATGSLYIGPFGAAQTRSLYSVLAGGAQVYWDNFGGIYLEGAGNQVVVRNFHAIRGVQSFQNVLPVLNGVNTTTLNLEFRIANRGKPMPAGWLTLNGGNLAAAIGGLVGYDAAVGLDMEVRITAVGNDLSRRINMITLPVNYLSSYVPPVGTVRVEVAGTIVGSRVAIFDNTVPASPVVLNSAVAGVNGTVLVDVPCDFSDTVVPILIRVRKAGYEPLQISSNYSNGDVRIPVSQNLVKDIIGAAIYGRGQGATTALISFDPIARRVDIGNGRVVGEDLYDAIAQYQASEVGILHPEILRFNGTDALLLNSWRLRRLNVGSINAGVDVSTAIDGSLGASPDDEVNGSVDMTPRTVRQITTGSALMAADLILISQAVRAEMDGNSTSLGTLLRRTAAML